MLITRVWASQPGDYFCVSSKTRSGRWEEHFFGRKQFREIAGFLREHSDRDLYWCPHGFTSPRRTKDNAAPTTLLWADLDEVVPSECKPMPTIAWRSSPGRHAAIWTCDAETTETLNRRLTYALGADRGGWDLTQVLRIPGTHNYKYPSAPQVRLLWDDGPTFELREIEQALPEKNEIAAVRQDAQRVYRKYEKQMSPFVRRNLLRGKPKEGKRSEVLWRLCSEILEAGCSEEEAFVLLASSPWNKFAGRRDEDAQLRREIGKAIGRRLEAPVPEPREEEDNSDFIVQLSEVQEQEIDWLWYPWFARGEITLLEGDPGVGKSYLAQMICAHVCDGKQLPQWRDGAPVLDGGRVLYFTMENTAATIAKRRLIDNECKRQDRFYQGEKFFTVDVEDADFTKVEEAFERVRPSIVIFDPINTYLGKTDTNNSKETQQALAIFKDLAQRFKCAIGLVRHLTKSTREKALYRGQGSIAFIGVARVCITVAWHPQQPGIRVMAPTKTNVTAIPRALTYNIRSLSGTKLDRSKLEWGTFCDISSDELLSSEQAKQESDTPVEEFIREMLSEGEVLESQMLANARARGFENGTLKRVAVSLGVRFSEGDLGPVWRASSSRSKTLAVKATSVQVRFGSDSRPKNGSSPTSRKPRPSVSRKKHHV